MKIQRRVLATGLMMICSSVALAEIDMKPRPTDEKDFPEYIQYLVDVAEPRTPEERNADKEMQDRFKDALVADSLFVGGPGFPAGFTPEQYEEAVQHSIDNRFDFIIHFYANGKVRVIETVDE